MSDTSVRALVTGRVQGVFFRQSTRQRASALGLCGWVRNLPDGRVAVRAQGPVEAVDELVAWLWIGPAGAQVTGVETEVVAADPTLRTFSIHR